MGASISDRPRAAKCRLPQAVDDRACASITQTAARTGPLKDLQACRIRLAAGPAADQVYKQVQAAIGV